MIVGLISDTHGLLRPEAVAALAGVSHIIHAGDVGKAGILNELRRIAPVTAVRGNVDCDGWGRTLPTHEIVTFGRISIYVLHILQDMRMEPRDVGCRAVISGHTHKPLIETRGGVLYVNPGSAGPRRFSLPVSVGFLEVSEEAQVQASIRVLAV